MTDPHAAFVGSIPQYYDQYLGPLLFHHYADDLVARIPVTPGMRVLETACGTGIVTERLLCRIDGRGTIVATDLNEAMFAYALRRGVDGAGLEWRQADATTLPFDDAEFDVVVCQFGFMFFPDKIAGARQAFRVLKPGGWYLFNVWDALAHNAVARIAHETVASFFPNNPPQFYTIPFSFHDAAPICAWLDGAGFRNVEWQTVTKVVMTPSATDAAIGLIEGNPIYTEIMQRRPEALADIKNALARNLAGQLGDGPVRCELRALVFTAHKRQT
jgi:ubiquinone/menaquinone biosynthesis C-methylase UbiE